MSPCTRLRERENMRQTSQYDRQGNRGLIVPSLVNLKLPLLGIPKQAICVSMAWLTLTSPRAVLSRDGIGWIIEPFFIDKSIEVVLYACRDADVSSLAATFFSVCVKRQRMHTHTIAHVSRQHACPRENVSARGAI